VTAAVITGGTEMGTAARQALRAARVRGAIMAVLGVVAFAAARDAFSTPATFAFWVDKQGRPRDCNAVQSSGSKILDNRTCAVIVKRGRFDPARTASGEPIESIGFLRIRWVIPN